MNEQTTPPPTIGKMGPYTVFITHPSDPESDDYTKKSYNISSPVPIQSPVQPPPVQYHKPTSPRLGFFWDAVAKVQNAHSSLDEYVAHWFGLNQSKYQWALDDYYETKGLDKVDIQVTHASTKAQMV